MWQQDPRPLVFGEYIVHHDVLHDFYVIATHNDGLCFNETNDHRLEMKDKKSNQLNSGSFRDNVAHSNSKQGIVTYKRGW